MALMSVLAGVGTLNSVLGGVTTNYKPAGRALDYFTNRLQPNQLNDPNTILTLYLKGKISDSILYHQMENYGYNKTRVDEQLMASKRILDMTEYIVLWRRGYMSDEDLRNYAQKTSFDIHQLENLKRITEYYPSVSDLIRFAVREVYTPGVIQEFGMLDDVPPNYIEAAGKAGIPEEQAYNFWAAHWDLPSLGMGYSMFHRGIINHEQLNMLMKSQDVMPFWRNKLQQLSYNVLTRVDARRMYGFGVIDEEKLLKTYQAQGYSPEDAQNLVDFTIQYEDDEYTGLTRSTIVDSYKKGIITIEQLKDFLTNLGLGETVIQFWLDRALYDKTIADVNKRKDLLKQLYLDGMETEEHIRLMLVEDGVPDTYINTILADFKLAKAGRYKKVSQDVLERWFEKGVIDESRFVVGMRRLGYNDDDITNFMIELLDPETPIKRKFLPVKKYAEWYISDYMTEHDLRMTLTDMDYNRRDIDIIIAESNQVKFEQED